MLLFQVERARRNFRVARNLAALGPYYLSLRCAAYADFRPLNLEMLVLGWVGTASRSEMALTLPGTGLRQRFRSGRFCSTLN
jgi:hypothetical protein